MSLMVGIRSHAVVLCGVFEVAVRAPSRPRNSRDDALGIVEHCLNCLEHNALHNRHLLPKHKHQDAWSSVADASEACSRRNN